VNLAPLPHHFYITVEPPADSHQNPQPVEGLACAQWFEDRQAELLDAAYFHVVFTVPDLIAAIEFQNQTVVYNILSRAAWRHWLRRWILVLMIDLT
jgi:hypothetical protein